MVLIQISSTLWLWNSPCEWKEFVFTFYILKVYFRVSKKNCFVLFCFFFNAYDNFGKHPCWVLAGCLLLSCIKFIPFVKAALNSDRLASKLALWTLVTNMGTSTFPAVCAELVWAAPSGTHQPCFQTSCWSATFQDAWGPHGCSTAGQLRSK